MRFVVIVAALGALLTCVNGAAPQVTSTYSQFKTIYIQDMTIRAYILTVEFDQPIYVNGVPIIANNITTASQQSDDQTCGSNNHGGGDPGMPPLTMQMDGKLTVQCGNLHWNVDFEHDNNDGPPRSLLATVSTSDTGSSFMGFLSGFAMPEYVNPKAIAFIKLISGSQGGGPVQYLDANTTETSITNCGDKVVQISSGIISNQAREFLAPSPITVSTVRTPICDFNSISSFKQAFDYVSGIAKRLQTDASLYKQFSFLQGALDSRDALQTCRQLVDPMFTTQTITKQLSPTRQCFYQQGTAEFNSSACCNYNLQFSQCCAPTTPTTNITIIKNITIDRIVNQCSHPDKIILNLYSYINTANQAAAQTENEQSLQDRFQKFMNTCQNLIYGKQCQVDADCRYSQSCDKQQKTCKIPWGSDADLLLKCYYDQFDPLLRSSLAGLWTLDEHDRDGFMAQMGSMLLTDDCVGSNSWNLQTRCQWNNEAHCNECTYSNKTTCLAPKTCNWNYQKTTQTDCLATTLADPSTQFCGQCFGDGSSCWSQSSPDLCMRDFYQTQSACQAANLTWYIPPWQNGYCVDPSKKTMQSCLPQDACPQLTSDGHNCESWGSHMCYAPNVTSAECYAANGFTKSYGGATYQLEWQPWRNGGNGICAFNRQWSGDQTAFTSEFCSSFSPAVNNKTVKFFPGGWWSEGQFNTQQKCTTGQCNWQDPLQRESGWGLTPQQCQQKQMCDQPCPKCRSQQWVGPGVYNYCYAAASNITSMDQCSRKSGQWTDNVVGNTGRCFFSQDAATSSQVSCLSYGQSIGVQTKWASCDNLSMGQCSDRNRPEVGELGSWLKCYWDMNAQCRTPQECSHSGRCNDDDKQIWQQNSPSIPGACQVNNKLNENGWPGDCSQLKSKLTNQTLTYARFPMRCVDPSVTNATICASIGGTWKTKAANQPDCLADVACYDEGSNWPNGKSAVECGKCGGSMAPIYSWTPGQWVNASMQPLTWKNKTFSSVNQWGKRVNGDMVGQSLISPAVYYYLGSSVYTTLAAKYSLISDLFTAFSCDCTPGRENRNCFGEVRASPIAAAVLQKGKVNKIETPLGVIKASLRGNNSNPMGGRQLLANGQVSITIAQVTAQNLAVLGPNNVPDYRVVRASPYVNKVVGQLAGDGMQVSGFTSDMTQVSVTLYLSQSITPDTTTYPVPWIAYLKPNTTSVFPLQRINVQFGNGSITTNNITSDGAYFPIYLQSNWTATLVTTRMPPTFSIKKSTTMKSSMVKGSTTQASVKASADTLENGSPSPAPTSVASTPASPNTPTPAATAAPTSAAAAQQYPVVLIIAFTCLMAIVLQ